jgi:SPP1 gp7 family putative phage head morphogenesis protein
MCDPCSAILARLDPADRVRLAAGAKKAQRIESSFQRKLTREFKAHEEALARALLDGKPPPELPADLVLLLLQNAHDAMAAGFEPAPKSPPASAKLGALPPMKIPSNPGQLRIWWDKVRKKKAPPRIQKLAEEIKAAYIAKVQEIWTKAGEAFREGKVWTQDDARAEMKAATRVGAKRGNMIVATETTRYFNQARKAFYDEVPSVTHYLFIATRDKATTPWCNSRRGLIFEKGSELLRRNTPPCHYNCRSEIVPLNRFNPRHKAMIADSSIAAKNNKMVPLLPGWNKKELE